MGNDKGEECARCKRVGQDRRTLWMACMYSMEELSVPFEPCAINGQYLKKTGSKYLPAWDQYVPIYENPDDKGEPYRHQFYTLRVCKDCRADWMGAIKQWFSERPDAEDEEANIPVRIRGATKMITRPEWDAMQKEGVLDGH